MIDMESVFSSISENGERKLGFVEGAATQVQGQFQTVPSRESFQEYCCFWAALLKSGWPDPYISTLVSLTQNHSGSK